MLQRGVEFRIPESRLPSLNGSISSCTIPSNVLSLSKVRFIDWWLAAAITSSLLPCCLFCKLGKLKTHFSWASQPGLAKWQFFGNQTEADFSGIFVVFVVVFWLKRKKKANIYTGLQFLLLNMMLGTGGKMLFHTLKERPRKFWDAGLDVSEAWASVSRHSPLDHLLCSSCKRGNKSTSHC